MSLSSKNCTIHFVGIGGIGMSGIAEVLVRLGHRVTGSDSSHSDTTARLSELGVQLWIGHSAEKFCEVSADVLVYSTAVAKNNPELVEALKLSIPVVRRAEMLAELMRLKRGIAVAGSHGKTTTTGVLSLLLKSLEPTVVIGGKFDAIGSNAVLGSGEWIVVEADESDGSFLRLSPEVAIVTNIDFEHLDHYQSFAETLNAFSDFLDRLPFYGQAILCSDCPHLRQLGKDLQKSRLWYGFDESAAPDFLLRMNREAFESEFSIFRKVDNYKNEWFRGTLGVPGKHNVLNASAALIAASVLGLDVGTLKNELSSFHGVQRRFEVKGEIAGHPLVEDYAHHPTEVRATLEAAFAAYGKKPLVIFQPHRYSRTRDLWKEFSTCFSGAARVVTLPVYAASEAQEKWTLTIDRENFSKNIKNVLATFSPNMKSIVDQSAKLFGEVESGAPILLLGAGDIWKIAPQLLEKASGKVG